MTRIMDCTIFFLMLPSRDWIYRSIRVLLANLQFSSDYSFSLNYNPIFLCFIKMCNFYICLILNKRSDCLLTCTDVVKRTKQYNRTRSFLIYKRSIVWFWSQKNTFYHQGRYCLWQPNIFLQIFFFFFFFEN